MCAYLVAIRTMVPLGCPDKYEKSNDKAVQKNDVRMTTRRMHDAITRKENT